MRIPYTLLLIVIVNVSVAQTWTALNGPSGGAGTTIHYDAVNSKVYSLVNGNIFVSTNDGATWTQLATPNNQSVGDFLLEGSTIIAVMFNQLYQSVDGGTVWTLKGTSGVISFTNIKKLPQAGVYLAHNSVNYNGMQITVDGGVTWKKILTTCCYGSQSDLDITSNGDIFIADYTIGIRRLSFPANATDLDNWNEANWVTVFPKQTTFNDSDMRIGVSLTDKLFINYGSTADGKTMFKSSIDQGATWQAVPMIGYTGSTFISGGVWSLSPLGKLYLFDNGGKKAWEYTDAAPTPWVAKGWPTVTLADQNVRAFAWKNNITVFATAETDGVFKSNNTTASWSQASAGINFGTGNDVAILNSGRILYRQGLAPKGYYYSTNGGILWEYQPFPYTIDKLVELPDNSLMLNAGGFVHFSNDGGINWTTNTFTLHEFRDIVVVAANDIYGFARIGAIRNTIDKGVTWTNVNTTGLPANRQMLRATRDNDGFFYVWLSNIDAGNKQELWKLNATVDPWVATKLTIPLTGNMEGIFCLSNKLYVTGGPNLMSSDKGLTWKNMGMTGTMLPVTQGTGAVAFSKPGNLLITQDDGLSFNNMVLPLADSRITSIALDPNGNSIAAANNSPALEFTEDLVLDASELPPFIDFNWQPLNGGPYGGTIKKLLKTPSGQLFAYGVSNLYHYNTASSQWDKLSIRGVRGVTIDNTGKQYVLVDNNTTTNLYTSINNGVTFVKEPGLLGDVCQTIVKNTNGDLIVGGSSGIYRSVDNGNSFTKVQNGSSLELVASSNGTLLSIYPTTLLRSVDNGVSWTSATAGIDLPVGVRFVSMNTAEGNNLVVITSNNIYKSTDNGSSWSSIKNNLATNLLPTGKFFLSPSGDYMLGSGGPLFSSTDQGTTWQQFSPIGQIGTMVWSGTDLYVAGSGPGVYRSMDNSTTFTQLNLGITEQPLQDLVFFKEKIFIISSNQLYTATDVANSWEVVPLQNPMLVSGILRASDTRLLAYGLGGIAQSLDGITWTTVTATGDYDNLTTADGINFYAVDETLTEYNFIFSTNLTNWTAVVTAGLPAVQSTGLSVRSFANDGTGKLYVLSRSAVPPVVYQVAFGETTKLSFLNPVSVVSHNNKILIFTSDGFIHETSDGVHWQQKVTPAGKKLSVSSLNYYFIANQDGVLWVSRNEGITWQSVGDTDFADSQFSNVVLDEFKGHAYGLVAGYAVQKSMNMVIPDDKAGPLVANFLPNSGATDIAATTKLAITLTDAAHAVPGRQIKVFMKGNPNAQFQFNADAVLPDGKQFIYTLPGPLTYLAEYYITIDNGAFKDIHGNEFSGILSNLVWTFTVSREPDAIGPIIAYTSTAPNIDQGTGSKTHSISVTDDRGLNMDSVKIHYRKITSKGSFKTEKMTRIGSTNTFEKALAFNEYDKMGLEFYFTAKDLANNKHQLISDSVNYSYINYSTPPTLEGLAFGGTAASYRMITFPYALTDDKVATILNELGEPDKNVWRMFTYDNDGSDDEWLEYPDFSVVERGKGYWINIKSQAEIKIEGATSPSNNRKDFFTITLQPGWNQIGNPYPLQISWSETQTGNSHANFGTFKKFTSAGYTNTELVNAYEGGFVHLNDTESKDIIIRFPGFTTGGRLQSTTFDSDLSASRWTLPLVLRHGTLVNSLPGIGMHPDALETLDRYDDLNPPPFLEVCELNFTHPATIPLSLDIVPRKDEYVWNFTVDTEPGSSAELQWSNSSLGNNEKELYLFDVSLQQRIDMREENHYSFNPKQSTAFRIYYGENLEEKIKPDFVLLGNAFPNPSSGKTFIPFTLPEYPGAQPVKLEVCDINGKIIATLKNETLAAGFYLAEWNPETHNLPNGLYLYRLAVAGNHPQVIYKRIILSK